MTTRVKIWINILFSMAAGPLLAVSLLIPLPFSETQADRAFGRMVRVFAGEGNSLFVIGSLSELDRMRSAHLVYISGARPDAVRRWNIDSARIRVVSRNLGCDEYPRNCELIRVGPDWFKGDRVYFTSAAYGAGDLGMHGADVILHRSWLGFWFVVYSTWVS